MHPRTFALLTPEGKGIVGELDDSGTVTFAVEAGPESSIRGTELFTRMIEHFGEEVQAIRGVWRRGPHTLVSTNIDKVNELTAKGLDLGEAIQYAWTVTRARKLGFNRVTVLGQPVGNPGAYSAIDVLLEKTGIE